MKNVYTKYLENRLTSVTMTCNSKIYLFLYHKMILIKLQKSKLIILLKLFYHTNKYILLLHVILYKFLYLFTLYV